MCCNLVSWAIFGLIVGGIARLLWPGPVGIGLFATMLLGVAGSLVGGGIAHLIWRGGDDPYHPGGYILSIIGAILVLWLSNTLASRAPPPPPV